MLSVAAIRDSIQLAAEENKASSDNALNEVRKSQDPRRASELLQEFALNTVESGQGLDEDTRQKLIAIRDILTNETYISLEQAHRHDQDLLTKHARAINECGQKHIRHLQQDVEGQEVMLVRDTESAMYKCRGLPHHSLDYGLLQTPDGGASRFNEWADDVEDKHSGDDGETETWRDHAMDEWGNYDPSKDPEGKWALQAVRSKPSREQIKRGGGDRFWKTWAAVNNPKYDDPEWAASGSCLAAHNDMFSRCDALNEFIKALPTPNCNPPIGDVKMEVPQCDGGIVGVDSDLGDWFINMKENARFYQDEWRALKKACDAARAYYKEICLDECARKQRQFETAFCSYRQGLHATCREYQGCHVLNEQQFMDLVKTVMYNADSRKIDWKAIHKIECYINVLISTETNEIRAKDLLNCEAGNLNTIETILTGFNETNYLSLIVPEINVSCWDLDVPQYIDFKECDMSSVKQHPCTEDWMARYEGLIAPASCTECAPIPDEFQYHMEQEASNYVSDKYGGGWYFVNEVGRSNTDINDLTELTAGGYHLPKYVTGKLRWNEVLVERVSNNWCDSWGAQSSYWVEDGGASMCVQSDADHVYCMNNGHGGHSWRQQPASHFTVNCGQEGLPDCDCWPKNKGNLCWAYEGAHAGKHSAENKPAPRHVRILSMEDDGSVVKISYQGEEKQGPILRVGNYNAFMQDAEGCRAITAVKYRVFVRCLGCSTEEKEFHTKDGAQFNSVMTMANVAKSARTKFTYEAWFRSPLLGKLRREIFGGASSGLTLINEGAVPCMHNVAQGLTRDGHKESGYQLHAGSTDAWGSVCFDSDTWYHVAITKDHEGKVTVFVNGKDVTAQGHKLEGSDDSVLASTLGGGFGDGGQLFNVRIWDHARTQNELYQDAFSVRTTDMSHINGLEHWWPLTDNLKDLITGLPLQGQEVRYSPIWCSDLEASGMRGC